MTLKALVLIAGAGVLAAMGLGAAAISAPGRADGPELSAVLFARLSDWLGGEAARHGPAHVNGFFNMALEVENVEIKGSERCEGLLRLKAGKLTARLDWLNIIMGRPNFSELTLENVTLEVAGPSTAGGGEFGISASPLAAAVFGPMFETAGKGGEGSPGGRDAGQAGGRTPFPFTMVQVDGARVVFVSPCGSGKGRRAHPRLKVADMRMKFGDDGGVDLTGNVVWRNQPFAISVRKGAQAGAEAKSAGALLDVSINNRLFDLTATGEATTDNRREPQFKGEFRLASLNVPDAARWLMFRSSGALDANTLTASGHVTWKGHELNIDRLEAGLDGRLVSGALSVKDTRSGRGTGARPEIEGTLALSDFDLGALARAALDDSVELHPRLSDLLRSANADLRVSVTKLSAGNVPGGPAALTLSLKDARLSANLADFAVLGGRVRGYFSVDASQPRRLLMVRATAVDVDTAELSRAFGMDGWMDGVANLNVEARAEAGDWPELLRSLRGEARASFAEGGGLGLDLVDLAERGGAGPWGSDQAEGWGWARRDFMTFEALRGEFAFEGGRIVTRNFDMTTSDREITGRGLVDLASRSVDWRFDIRPAAAAGTDATPAAGGTGAAASFVNIKGPWRHPAVQAGEPSGDDERTMGVRPHLPGGTPDG